MTTPNCPRCHKYPALPAHDCELQWTGENGDPCLMCGGEGGTYIWVNLNHKEKIKCETCKGLGMVNTPKEEKCNCCTQCIIDCHYGKRPEGSCLLK